MAEPNIDKAAALAAGPEGLGTFEDRRVVRAPIRITGAGDGLSEAVAIEPHNLKIGDEVTVILKTVVTGVKHVVGKGYDPDDDEAPLWREQTIKAVAASVVSVNGAADEGGAADLVERHLREQAIRIQRAKDAAKGEPDLGTTPGAEGWSAEALASGQVLRAVPDTGDDDQDEDGESPLYVGDEDEPEA